MASSHVNSGPGAVTLLGVAFVILKLCKVIDWSWWWVTLPFWGGASLFLIALGFVVLVLYVKEARDGS